MFDFGSIAETAILFKKERGSHFPGTEAKYHDIVGIQ